MIVTDRDKVENSDVSVAYYKGKPVDVTGVGIRWLSKAGLDESGNPLYGLRLFTVEPGAEIPTHDHLYSQTIYLIEGTFECWAADSDTGARTEVQVCGPGDVIYVPGMEPHGMRNIDSNAPGIFLCCICTVPGDDTV